MQHQEMQTLDKFVRSKCKAAEGNALILCNQWRSWYDGLSWFNCNVNPLTLKQAHAKINAIAGIVDSPFGDEVEFSLTSTGMTRQSGASSVLAKGSKGPQVAVWQKIIGVAADGDFGPATEKATKAWQTAHGLKADGIVGPESWSFASSVTPDATLNAIHEEISKDQPFGMPVNDAPFAGAVGVTPTGVDLGDVDAPGFLTGGVTSTVAAAGGVQEASMFGALANLPLWGKVTLGVMTAGGILMSTPVKYGGLKK